MGIIALYYTFYDPEHDFKEITSGKFTDMPFYWDETDLPVDIPMVFGIERSFAGDYNDPYNCTGLLNREIAKKLQEVMPSNETLFTDLMDENYTDTLVFRIT